MGSEFHSVEYNPPKPLPDPEDICVVDDTTTNLSSSMLSTLSSSLDHGGNDELGGATAAAMEFIVDRVTTNAPTLEGGNVAAAAMEAPPSETYNGGFIYDRLTPEPTPG